MTPHLLLVEDDPFVSALSEAFLRQHFQVTLAPTASAALEKLGKRAFDLVLLDLGLPDEDGLVLARQMKAKASDLPIIFLTSRDTKEDMIAGLEIGGDDYIVKPFDPDVLLARITAVLRRTDGRARKASTIVIETEESSIQVDVVQRRVTISDVKELELTRAEFDLILALAQAGGRVLSRGSLLDAIATRPDHDADERVIDALVSKIRRKLTALGLSKSPVETVRGLGYRIGKG